MDGTPVWVFGYGSLIWDPGFAPAETRRARLHGWRRSFCLRSIHWRGTEAEPGLVLALEPAPGAACDGLALRLPEAGRDAALAALRARELVSYAYAEAALPVATGAGEVTALAYVIDPASPQYCAGLAPEAQAAIIARAIGLRGPNRDYLAATVARLAALGIADPELEALAARVRALAGGV